MYKNSKARAGYRMASGVVHFFVIVILALVIFAGIGYYAYKNGQIKITPSQKQFQSAPTSTPKPTSNWKTYSSQKYNIEFKYPPSLSYSELGPKLDLPHIETVVFSTDSNRFEQFELEIIKMSQVTISEDSYQKTGYLYMSGSCNSRLGFNPLSKTVINLPTLKVLKVGGKNIGPKSCYYFKNYKYLFVISTVEFTSTFGGQDAYENAENNLLNLLSTFKFTDKYSPIFNFDWALQGKVLENKEEKQEERIIRYLVILTDRGEKYKIIYYDVGGFDACSNGSFDNSKEITTGTTAEIFGDYSNIESNQIYTCNSEDYYIKIVKK